VDRECTTSRQSLGKAVNGTASLNGARSARPTTGDASGQPQAAFTCRRRERRARHYMSAGKPPTSNTVNTTPSRPPSTRSELHLSAELHGNASRKSPPASAIGMNMIKSQTVRQDMIVSRGTTYRSAMGRTCICDALEKNIPTWPRAGKNGEWSTQTFKGLGSGRAYSGCRKGRTAGIARKSSEDHKVRRQSA
jgi:hypothetical protein